MPPHTGKPVSHGVTGGHSAHRRNEKESRADVRLRAAQFCVRGQASLARKGGRQGREVLRTHRHQLETLSWEPRRDLKRTGNEE